ncbi:hypothetical protein HN682_05445 [Candidatus Peregrinibacteria bacterium]|jgi:hypothetical protein|nr:hypothetical protein [Candidatus Peregrinibacteria bacterium]
MILAYSYSPVYCIDEDGIQTAIKDPDYVKRSSRSPSRYIASEECILLAHEKEVIKIITGFDVLPHILFSKIVTFAVNHDMRLEIIACGNLHHLNYLDKLVEMHNNLLDS